jgi:hypothetical protein
MSQRLAGVASIIGFLVLTVSPRVTRAQTAAARPDKNIVTCRVLEMHTIAQPPVIIVLFHQRDKKDQPRFASLLKQADGSTVQIRIGKGDWQTVSVVRLRNCFGRGLLTFPAGATKLKDKDEFLAKFLPKAEATATQ